QKELLCMHDNVDDLIESALNSKLLLINSQSLNKEKQEVKNVVEEPAERRPHIIESLQNFRVIRKSSTSLKDTSQIFLVHALSTEEPEHSFSIGYEHLCTTPETELDEVTESSAKNLLPILCECEVTSEDESKCDMPIQDQSSSIFMTFLNTLFKDNDDLTSSDDESLFEEDVPIEQSKYYSNPLFDDDEINSDELESHVEALHVDNSISNSANELSDNVASDFDNPSVPRPPPEPPDAEFDFELDAGDEISVVMNA
nr:hypothetical protein [Tanacetum cinerariifolium]